MSDPDHPKAGKPEPFLRTPAHEGPAAVSPDGRWIAYQSNESGRPEVYVRPFPGPGGKWQVSSTGGVLPIWSPNGRELFFQNLDNRIMVADYAGKTGSSGPGTFLYRAGKALAQTWPISWLNSSGKTEPLIARHWLYLAPRFSPDGQRLALIQRGQGLFVYDWQRETMSLLRAPQGAAIPVWSPDGKHIVFCLGTSPSGDFGLRWIRADGTGETQHLLESKNDVYPYSFFPDGRRLAYIEHNPDTGYDL
jgi:Tol biopolymer transport system component